MTPFIIVLIVGFVLHVAVGLITRTPEDDQTPLRWRSWHTFLVGLASTGACLAVAVAYFLVTGTLLPFWALLLAADVLTIGWKLRDHHKRQQERKALQSLFDRPSFGEG